MQEHRIEWEMNPEMSEGDPVAAREREKEGIWPFLTAVAIIKVALFLLIYLNPYTGG